jgi:hypothetical protein
MARLVAMASSFGTTILCLYPPMQAGPKAAASKEDHLSPPANTCLEKLGCDVVDVARAVSIARGPAAGLDGSWFPGLYRVVQKPGWQASYSRPFMIGRPWRRRLNRIHQSAFDMQAHKLAQYGNKISVER